MNGMIDSSQPGVRGARDRGAGGAVVDEGGLAVAWQDFAVRRQSRQATKTPAVPFLVVLPVFYSRCHGYAIFTQNIGAAGLLRCTPAISISFVTTMLRSQGKRTNISITLAGRAADPHRPHPCSRCW